MVSSALHQKELALNSPLFIGGEGRCTELKKNHSEIDTPLVATFAYLKPQASSSTHFKYYLSIGRENC